MANDPTEDAAWQRGIVRETARGRLALWVFEPGLLIFQLASHGDRAFVEPIVAGLERSLQYGPTVQLFVDAELMTTYDSELRTEVTAALLPERHRIACLHIVVRSKLVAMGVSVANLALGGLMTIHRDSGSFVAALQAATHRANVVNFSTTDLMRRRRQAQR
jgi:hypothetical protein